MSTSTYFELAGLAFLLWIIFVMVRGIFRKFRKAQLARREPHFLTIGAYVYSHCIAPFGASAKEMAASGVSFLSLDFPALIAKHRCSGHSDRDQLFNRVFEEEVNVVVTSIKEGSTGHTQYMRDAWFGGNVMEGREGLTNVVRDLYLAGKLEVSFRELKEIGEWCKGIVSKADAEAYANAALRGEPDPYSQDEVEDDDEAEYGENFESFEDSDDSPRVSHREEAALSTPRRGLFQNSYKAPVFTPSKTAPSRPAHKAAPPPSQVKRESWYTVQRMNRGGQWQNKFKSNSMRQADQQMRSFQSGAYRLQDENQPNVRWRIVDQDGRVQ